MLALYSYVQRLQNFPGSQVSLRWTVEFRGTNLDGVKVFLSLLRH